MADFIKASILFILGFVVLANLGDLFEKTKRTGVPPYATSAPYAASALAVTDTQDVEASEIRSVLAEQPLPETKPVVRNGTYAQVCASFDIVNHPEQVIDILEYASETTGTPVDVLFSVWQKETGYLDGAGRLSGGCDVMSELALRCKVGSAGGCRIGPDGRPTDCSNPDACHFFSMERLAKRFDWNLQGMTCSCPGKDKRTGERKGYGGCCGPFQFSGAEVDDEYAIPLNLDPMRFCGGALIAGWELKKHHDNAFKPKWSRKHKRYLPGRGTVIQAKYGYKNEDYAAWHAAMSRYYGGDEGGVYGDTAMKKLMKFQIWRATDAQQPGYLVAQILGLHNTRYSLRKLRSWGMTYASNP